MLEPDLATLEAHLGDPMWRLCHLYKITIKGEEDAADLVLQFRPNRAQRRFLDRLWYRNIILKARQLGFTTLIAILWLDHALFNANARCAIIAQDHGSAEAIFRDKVKFAYDSLWPVLKERFPLERDSASELLFQHNNSSVRVATSVRSGTIHRLHVSEYGKICAKTPDKAKEVKTGSLPSVPLNGIVVIESTAEGRDGEFAKMTTRALAASRAGTELTERDYRLHFYPWWEEPAYTLGRPELVPLTASDLEYFDALEAAIGRDLNPGQRAWYVSTRDNDFAGDPESMWQEYPGTPEEAFQVSTEGCYFARQLATAQRNGRICDIPIVEGVVNTFWDIGRSDSTSIWFEQPVGMEHRFIRYFEDDGQTLGYYVKYLQDTGYIFGNHYLPHDAAHKRLSDRNLSIEEMLAQDFAIRNVIIVDRITELQAGIQQARAAFTTSWFDRTGTAQGLERLAGFKRKWNKALGAWMDEPAENEHIHGADAFRQFGQALANGQYVRGIPQPESAGWANRKRASWRTA